MDLIEPLEALRALRDEGTTGRAAARLRLTQSAVSKRLAALEAHVGAPLTEPVGRRLRLTPEGERLLADAEPLLVRLREVLAARGPTLGVVTVAATESLLCADLPGRLRLAAEVAEVTLELHAHRGPVVVERVREGACAVGVVAGVVTAPDLVVRPLGEEALVVVGEAGPLWTVEARSLTWPSIERGVARAGLVVEGRMESAAALVQVARAGIARALVPAGIAAAMGATGAPVPGVTRPISLVARSGALARPSVRAFAGALAEAFRPPGAS